MLRSIYIEPRRKQKRKFSLIFVDFSSIFYLLPLLLGTNWSLEFSLNVSMNSVTKIFVITSKELKPAISCARDQDAATAPAVHM